MDERTRLLTARGLIEQVLREHQLVGQVILCAERGEAEAMLHLDAPWCRARLEQHGAGDSIRLRSKLADYGGDKDAQRRDLESTLGALNTMFVISGGAALALLTATEQFNEATGAEHTPLRKVHKQ